MKTLPPRHEIEADLAATIRDVARLTAIVENLDSFINDAAGEDRARFRVDLMRYQNLKNTATDLADKIRDALTRSDEPDTSDGHDWEGFEGGCERFGCEKECGAIREAVKDALRAVASGAISATQAKQHVHTSLTMRVRLGQLADDVPDRDDVVEGWFRQLLGRGT